MESKNTKDTTDKESNVDGLIAVEHGSPQYFTGIDNSKTIYLKKSGKKRVIYKLTKMSPIIVSIILAIAALIRSQYIHITNPDDSSPIDFQMFPQDVHLNSTLMTLS